MHPAALCLPRARREQAASLGDALRYLDFVGLAACKKSPTYTLNVDVSVHGFCIDTYATCVRDRQERETAPTVD